MSNQGRVPAGVPAGGQFAPEHRAESAVVLSAAPEPPTDTVEPVEPDVAALPSGVPLDQAPPPDIDSVLAELRTKKARAEARKAQEIEAMHRLVGDERYYPYGRISRWRMTDDAVMLRAAEIIAGPPSPDRAALEAARERIAAFDDEILETARRSRPLNDEFVRRGGWTRAYLVDNADGHVHSSTGCKTCRATTQFHWVTEMSGADEAEIVAAAGERACTECYPSAPTEMLTRPSRIEGPNQRAAREESERRAAQKAAKAAGAAAKAITAPDGQPLRGVDYAFSGGGNARVLHDSGVIKTEVAAQRAASAALFDLAWYGDGHPGAEAWRLTAQRCVEALAAKRGVDADALHAELLDKARARVRKERG